jgi:hypothetical protein
MNLRIPPMSCETAPPSFVEGSRWTTYARPSLIASGEHDQNILFRLHKPVQALDVVLRDVNEAPTISDVKALAYRDTSGAFYFGK